MNPKMEFDDNGNFRISVDGAWGEWALYQHIATVVVHGVTYIAVTDYYSGTLPIETVFALTSSTKPTELVLPTGA